MTVTPSLAGTELTPEALAQAGDLEASLGRPKRAAALFALAVERAGEAAPADWWVIWVNQLERLASEAPGIAAFLADRREAERVLRCALAQLSEDSASEALITYRLVEVLLHLDDNTALAQLADELTGRGAPRMQPRERALVGRLLADALPAGRREAWVQTASPADPDQPEALADAAIAFDRLWAEAERGGGFDLWWRVGHAALALGRDADAEAAFRQTQPRLAKAALGPLAEALADIRAAVNRNYLFDDVVDHAALAATLARSGLRLAAALDEAHPWTPAMLFEAEEALETVRQNPFRVLARVPRDYGYIDSFDARYGALDLKAYAVVHQALLEHEALLLDHAAAALLSGRPCGGLDVLRLLPARLADTLLEVDQPGVARARLEAIRDQGLASEGLERALERCALHEGRTDAAAARWRVAAGGRPAGSAHRTAYAHDWHRLEGLEAVTRWEEPGISGRLERVRHDGGVDSFAHATTPFRLEVTLVRDLELRGDELVIGPRGTLLRPSDWHVLPGDYPSRHALSLVAARTAAVLCQQSVDDIDEPILVLAGNDSLSTPNYYHWMTHQLTRAVWAWREGWLAERRLLVPADSRPWMFEALRLAGISEDRCLLQPRGRSLRLRDAWLVSAFEHPGAALLRATREQLWRGAEAGEGGTHERLVFLVRPPGTHTPIFESEGLLAAVRDAGFECVDTGELGVAEQVRLLAGARGVGGFDGAALTNLMFARPGVRVLDLSADATLWPDFSGIAVALGQDFRYLLGAIPPSCRAVRPLHQAPVRFDLDQLARQLQWARGGDSTTDEASDPDDPRAQLVDGKAMAERGEFDSLARLCRSLLGRRGEPLVDEALGGLLRLLIDAPDAAAIASIEEQAFATRHLAAGWNPGGVSLRYLAWRRQLAFPPAGARDRPKVQRYADAARALWPALDEETRLILGLYSQRIEALTELGASAELEALTGSLLRLWPSDARYEPLLVYALLRLPLVGADSAAGGLLGSVFDLCSMSVPMTPQQAAWTWAVLLNIDHVATTLEALVEVGRLHRRWREAMERLGEEAADLLAHPRRAELAQRTADFALLHEWLALALGHLDDSDTLNSARWALSTLMSFHLGDDLHEVIVKLNVLDPSNRDVALHLAGSLASRGTPLDRLESILRAIDPKSPGNDSAVVWLARRYEISARGEDCLRWLGEHDLRGSPEAREISERVGACLQRGPMPRDGGAQAEALEAAPAPLDAILAALRGVVNGDLTHHDGRSLAALRGKLKKSLTDLENWSGAIEGLDGQILLAAATGLAGVAGSHFEEIVQFYHGTPAPPGPQYGTLDPARYALVLDALHEHALWLTERSLHAALRGAPTPSLQPLCRLAETHVHCALRLDRPDRPEALLAQLAGRGLSPHYINRLLERCALQRGDIDGARRLLDQADRADELHVMLSFDAWCAAEGLTRRPLHRGAECATQLEFVDKKGKVHTAPHRVPPGDIAITQATTLRVRDTELTIGSRGALLKPHPWHLRDTYDGYPDPGPGLLNGALRACRLRRPTAQTTIDEPVLVLANMDATVFYNYYHWMLLILPRFQLAMERGLLADRRLLVPDALSPWMTRSIDLIGLPQDRMIAYGAKDDLVLSNARLISSLEFPGARLLASLRTRLWKAAGVRRGANSESRLVWLSRRSQLNRPLMNEDTVEAIARDLGFEVVQPEALDIADQVRMTAGARAIAGVVGAGMANLVFARPGTQVLGLVGEEESYPTFVDLCAVMTLDHRWLFGRVDPRAEWWGPTHKPFEVDLKVAKRELRRLAQGVPARAPAASRRRKTESTEVSPRSAKLTRAR